MIITYLIALKNVYESYVWLLSNCYLIRFDIYVFISLAITYGLRILVKQHNPLLLSLRTYLYTLSLSKKFVTHYFVIAYNCGRETKSQAEGGRILSAQI